MLPMSLVRGRLGIARNSRGRWGPEKLKPQSFVSAMSRPWGRRVHLGVSAIIQAWGQQSTQGAQGAAGQRKRCAVSREQEAVCNSRVAPLMCDSLRGVSCDDISPSFRAVSPASRRVIDRHWSCFAEKREGRSHSSPAASS